MHDGYCVLQWVQENGYTLTAISETIGYARPTLSQALSHNRISPRLAERLQRHYGLQVLPTDRSPWEVDHGYKQRGRPSGPRREASSSKLDAHMNDIAQLLAQGVLQKDIARRYDTTPSNLHGWMKKHELSRKRRTT